MSNKFFPEEAKKFQGGFPPLRPPGYGPDYSRLALKLSLRTPVAAGWGTPEIRGGKLIYYHGPRELCIIAGGPQNQSILS